MRPYDDTFLFRIVNNVRFGEKIEDIKILQTIHYLSIFNIHNGTIRVNTYLKNIFG